MSVFVVVLFDWIRRFDDLRDLLKDFVSVFVAKKKVKGNIDL